MGLNMFLRTRIDSICVLEKNISIKLTSSDTRHNVFEAIKKIKGLPYHFRFEQNKEPKLSITGTIKSVNLRKRIHIVLHIPKESKKEIMPIVSPLIEIKGTLIYLVFEPPQKDNITELLNKASKICNKSPENLLFELSTFEKNGAKIMGKHNIEELSDKHKEVVKNKLLKIIYQSKNKSSHKLKIQTPQTSQPTP